MSDFVRLIFVGLEWDMPYGTWKSSLQQFSSQPMHTTLLLNNLKAKCKMSNSILDEKNLHATTLYIKAFGVVSDF